MLLHVLSYLTVSSITDALGTERISRKRAREEHALLASIDPEALEIARTVKKCAITRDLLWPGTPVFEHDRQYFDAVAFTKMVSKTAREGPVLNPITRKPLEEDDLKRLAIAVPSSAAAAHYLFPFGNILCRIKGDSSDVRHQTVRLVDQQSAAVIKQGLKLEVLKSVLTNPDYSDDQRLTVMYQATGVAWGYTPEALK